MNRAFVIGNGGSRSGVDLSSIKHKGTMFGCNALYRDLHYDFDLPHYLIAIDERIIDEIKNSDFPSKRFIEPPENEKWEPVELHWGRAVKEDWNPARPRSNAGVNAVLEAVKRGFTDIWMIGMDFLVVDETIAVSNQYHGTHAYEMETRATLADSRNRMQYMGWVIEKYVDINFVFCYPSNIVESGIYKPEATNTSIFNLEDL